MSISHGLITGYGFPYISGNCKMSIQSYKGPHSNNFTVAIDKNMLTQNFDFNNKETVRKLGNELERLVGYEILGGPNVECMINDDCHTKMDVCDSDQTCQQAKLSPDAVCAKGFDCETGEMCFNGKCGRYNGRCGSIKDCPAGNFCDKNGLQYPTCRKRVPVLNAFGFNFGTIFYNPTCKLIIEDSDTMHFYCEFIYEADAILQSLWKNDHLFLKDDNAETECQLLHLQFRTFQIDMVDLQILNGYLLEISDCKVVNSIITTPSPPRPTSSTRDQTTSTLYG